MSVTILPRSGYSHMALSLVSQLLLLWPWLRVHVRSLPSDLRAAARNFKRLMRQKPAIAQFILAIWPVLFGLKALSCGDTFYAVAPLIYDWLHTGVLCWFHARVLGGWMLALGLWQLWALLWPMRLRCLAMRTAMRWLCGTNAALAVGFFLACPQSLSWEFYLFIQAGVSVWCLWRLAPRKLPLARASSPSLEGFALPRNPHD
ncbi:MAG: hypothetical protein ACRYFS_10375 [Janthinobacterium lividum]